MQQNGGVAWQWVGHGLGSHTDKLFVEIPLCTTRDTTILKKYSFPFPRPWHRIVLFYNIRQNCIYFVTIDIYH